jgi:hypothetical protein
MSKMIPLTRGKVALVDDADYEYLNQWKWFLSFDPSYQSFRAVANIGGKTVLMHRLIMNTPKGAVVDHINHDTLDNRRCNLRNATSSQNAMNTRKRKNTYSKYKGVRRSRNKRKVWNMVISKDGVRYEYRSFSSEEEAAHAYDKKARELFGEFAVLNFPDGGR